MFPDNEPSGEKRVPPTFEEVREARSRTVRLWDAKTDLAGASLPQAPTVSSLSERETLTDLVTKATRELSNWGRDPKKLLHIDCLEREGASLTLMQPEALTYFRDGRVVDLLRKTDRLFGSQSDREVIEKPVASYYKNLEYYINRVATGLDAEIRKVNAEGRGFTQAHLREAEFSMLRYTSFEESKLTGEQIFFRDEEFSDGPSSVFRTGDLRQALTYLYTYEKEQEKPTVGDLTDFVLNEPEYTTPQISRLVRRGELLFGFGSSLFAFAQGAGWSSVAPAGFALFACMMQIDLGDNRAYTPLLGEGEPGKYHPPDRFPINVILHPSFSRQDFTHISDLLDKEIQTGDVSNILYLTDDHHQAPLRHLLTSERGWRIAD